MPLSAEPPSTTPLPLPTGESSAAGWKVRLQQLTAPSFWLPAAGLILLALITYQKVWSAGFIWDDDAHVTQNQSILSPTGLWDIWTTSAARICPLVLTTFWAEYHLFGADPLPFHLINVLVHGLGAVALWRVLRALNAPGAWLAAALWELHPVQVETVAWITELKNTQSGVFFLLSILYFIKFLRSLEPKSRIYPMISPAGKLFLVSLGCATLAMASKSSTVVLPPVLALCAWWIQGGWQWRNVRHILPFFVLSCLAGLLSLWTQNLEGANDVEWARTLPEKLATAGNVFWFYLGKLAWPHPIMFVYPRWQIDPHQWISYLATASALLVLAILWWRRRQWRSLFLTYTYFGVALLPVLGILDHFFLRYSFVGDHFQYLASMGPLALLGVALTYSCQKLRLSLSYQVIGAGLLLAAMAIPSWQRVAVYRSNTTLWRDSLQQNPAAYMAYNNLATEELNQGLVEPAIAHWQKSIELWPHNAKGYSNIAAAYLQIPGKTNEAIENCRKALALDRNCHGAHVNLAFALYQQGKIQESLDHWREAIRISPRDTVALNALAWVLATGFDASLRNGTEALGLAERACALSADSPKFMRTLAAAHAATGDFTSAKEIAQRAIRLNAGANSPLARGLSQDMECYRSNLPVVIRAPSETLHQD